MGETRISRWASCNLKKKGTEKAYSVGDSTAHRCDHGDAATVTPADHLFGDCLRGHEDTGDVDLPLISIFTVLPSSCSNLGVAHLKHGVRVLLRVLQRRCFLLDARCCYQSVQLPLHIRDILDDLIQLRHISDIDLTVVEGGSYSSYQYLYCHPASLRSEPSQPTKTGKTYLVPPLPSFAPYRSPDSAHSACPRHTPLRQPPTAPLLAPAPDLSLLR